MINQLTAATRAPLTEQDKRDIKRDIKRAFRFQVKEVEAAKRDSVRFHGYYGTRRSLCSRPPFSDSSTSAR